jgi:hypothetical protein
MKFNNQWWVGKSNAQMKLLDQDQDGIPDHIERTNYMRFIVGRQQSWYRFHPRLKRIKYDEEWLAYEIQDKYVDGTYDNYDWAKPGKNWPD